MRVGIDMTDADISNNKFLYVKGARDLSHLEHISKTGDSLLHEAREALNNLSIRESNKDQNPNQFEDENCNVEKEMTQIQLELQPV